MDCPNSSLTQIWEETLKDVVTKCEAKQLLALFVSSDIKRKPKNAINKRKQKHSLHLRRKYGF